MINPNDAGAGVGDAVGDPVGVTGFEGLEAALTPNKLDAATVQVTVPPGLTPVTVNGLDVPLAVAPPVQVAVYPVIGDPPEAGGVNVTTTDPPEAVALPITGTPGCVA